MFRFTQEPSPGSYNQCLAKIKGLVQQCASVQTLSVLRRHILTWCAYVWLTVPLCIVKHTLAHQVRICRRNTDNVCTGAH